MVEVPLDLPTGRVVGKFIFEVQDNNDPGEEPQLVPVTGDVTIKSSIDNLRIFDPTLGKFITFRGPHKAIVDASGQLATPDPATNAPMYPGMSLWSNDSDKLSVKGWTYTATFNLKTIDGKTLNLQPATFTLATGQEVDLADVVQVPATPGYGLPQAEGAALRAEAAAIEAEQSSTTAIQMAQSVIDRADAGEFEGAQGLPGNATMRVVTSVGTRVFITNGVTERMISGDTGLRNLPVAVGTAGAFNIRRVDTQVEIRLVGFASSVTKPNILTVEFPSGFRPGNSINVISRGSNGTDLCLASLDYLGTSLTVEGLTTGDVSFVIQYLTRDPWPTALPGTPT